MTFTKSFFAAALILLAIFAATAAAPADPLPEWLKPVSGSVKALPADIPLHPAFTWSKPVLVKDDYSKEIHSFIQTNRVKKVSPESAFNYYEKKMKAKGWMVSGPAGGASSLGGIFTKGKRKFQLTCYSGTEVGTDVPIDPRGTKVEILY
jgi:hypothetical protein